MIYSHLVQDKVCQNRQPSHRTNLKEGQVSHLGHYGATWAGTEAAIEPSGLFLSCLGYCLGARAAPMLLTADPLGNYGAGLAIIQLLGLHRYLGYKCALRVTFKVLRLLLRHQGNHQATQVTADLLGQLWSWFGYHVATWADPDTIDF